MQNWDAPRGGAIGDARVHPPGSRDLTDKQRETLHRRLLERIGEGAISSDFDALIPEVFAYQFEHCAPYAALCRSRGIRNARSLSDPGEIPLVPTDAFKYYRIACFPPVPDEIRFETSGTTQGRPGVHSMRDTQLYDAGAMVRFRCSLLPERRPMRFFSLTGSPAEMPHSSLVHMIETAGRRFSLGGASEYFFAGGTLEFDRLVEAVREAAERDQPVLLMSTAFALVHALDAAREQAVTLTLPPGSRLMETGGYKGRSRELSREELYAGVGDVFGLPPDHIVNEYGMTEMSSQFYDRAAATDEGVVLDPIAHRVKLTPPWVRSRVLDPRTLEPAPEGATGLLAHIDLANLDSCSFLLSGDAAVAAEGGFVLEGRLAGRELRGCSLDYEAITP